MADVKYTEKNTLDARLARIAKELDTVWCEYCGVHLLDDEVLVRHILEVHNEQFYKTDEDKY